MSESRAFMLMIQYMAHNLQLLNFVVQIVDNKCLLKLATKMNPAKKAMLTRVKMVL